MTSEPLPHIAIFPFFSKGHTIPLLHLARLIHRRRLATLTFITTPSNAPFIRRSLAADDVEPQVIELPFSGNFPAELPTGIESTDKLPSMSLFVPFVKATKLLQPAFERALSDLLPTLTFLISDMFFAWTVESASKFAIPRVVFSGMGKFTTTMSNVISRDVPHAGVSSPTRPFVVPGFPHIQLTKSDLSPDLAEPDQHTTFRDFVMEARKSRRDSDGIVANTFYELEAAYVDCWNRDFGPEAWCVGPLCLARPEAAEAADNELIEWLDSRFAMKRPVLYVAFGTQAEVSTAQMQEIAIGLERSGLDFLWVVRSSEAVLGRGFEERVKGRGRVVREWVDQLGILRHEGVGGFMSHCGWNSVMESVSAGVPILAWPMMAEQHLNAKFVVDEARIGLSVRARDGSKDGLVMSEVIREVARELVLGEKGRMAREKAENLADLAAKAMADGGSSASTLGIMIEELSQKRAVLRNAQ